MSVYDYNGKYEPSYPTGKYYGQKYETTEMPFELKYSSPTYKYPTKPSSTFSEGSKQFVYNINISDGSDWYYLTGHSVNGKKVYPASGYLYLVWNAFATYHNTKFYELPVAFDDVEFNYPTVFDAPQAEMFVRFYETKNNMFEVYYNDKVVVSGRIYLPTETETIGWKEYTQNMWRTKPYTDVLEEEEIYKEFETKGYEYQDLFKGIYKLTTDGTKGELYWYGKWLSFLETIMQMNYWNKPGYYYPTYIKSIRINPRVHDKWIQKFDESNYSYLKNKKPTFDMKYYGKYEYPEYTGLVPFYYDPYKNVYTSGGVEIYGFYSKPYPKFYFEKYTLSSDSTVPNAEYPAYLAQHHNTRFTECPTYTTYCFTKPSEYPKPTEFKSELKYPTTSYEWKHPAISYELKSECPATPYEYNQITGTVSYMLPLTEISTPIAIQKEIKPEYTSIPYPKPWESLSTQYTSNEFKCPFKTYFSYGYPLTTEYYKPKYYQTYPINDLIPKNTFEKLNYIDITPKMHPIFVIHPIEGHVNMLREWAKYMKYPVYGIQYTNEATKYETIEKLASFYLEKIEKQFGSETPFHLIGYSFGSNVAYEMTLKKNRVLSLTFLDNSFWHPFLKTKYLKKDLPTLEAEFIYNFVYQFTNKIDYKQFVSDLALLDTFDARLQYTIKYFFKIAEFNYDVFEFEQALKSYVKRMFMTYYYQPKSCLNSQVLIIKPTKFNDYVELPGEDYGLSSWVRDRVKIHSIEADQSEFLNTMNSQDIAVYLNDYLKKYYF